MPPFRRKTLVLIGAQGVGRRSLKNKLILWDPDRYGTTVPCELEVGPAGWRLGPSGVQGWILKVGSYPFAPFGYECSPSVGAWGTAG